MEKELADLTEKNLRLLGAQVVPALQSLDDNNYAGFEPAVAAGEGAPCRIGTRLVRRALDRYLDSGDADGALRHMDAVTWEMEEGSICGLGVAAALPLISARKHFPEAFGPRDSQEDPR